MTQLKTKSTETKSRKHGKCVTTRRKNKNKWIPRK